MAYRTRDLLVRQRTQTINALRAHRAELCVVAPTASRTSVASPPSSKKAKAVPEAVMALGRMLVTQISALSGQIENLDKGLRQRASGDDTTKHLMTIPGVGAITATALTTFAPPCGTFAKGRDFAAWVGLTPRQHSSRGKERLGETSKMGQRDIRRLLITGAVSVVRWAARNGAPKGCGWHGSWRANRECMPRWRSPTSRRGSPGR